MKNELIKRLKEYKEMLYVVDMLNGFVYEGALHDKHIGGIIDEQIKLIEEMKKEEEGISFIKDCHTKDSQEFKYYAPHSIDGTSEALLVPELREYEKDALVYNKNSTCAIFAPNMMEHLEMMKSLKVVIGVGCCTDICILNFFVALKNYFNQMNRDVVIILIKNAMDTYHIPGVHDRDEYTNMAYKLMEQAGIILVDDINELLRKKEEMGLKKVRRMN